MSQVLSQSLNGSMTSPQSNHSSGEIENCNSLLMNGGGGGQMNSDMDDKKEIVENNFANDEQQHTSSQDQPMEEDEETYAEEENFEEDDHLGELKKNLAGEIQRQLNASNTNQLNNLNNLNSLLGNSNSSLLNNLAQWNPATLAALGGNANNLNNNFNGLAGLTQALNAAAFNSTLNQQSHLNNNQGSPQNSSSGSQHTPSSLNASQLSSNGNLNYQNGSNSSNSHLTHVEAAKGYTYEEQFKQLYELSSDKKRKEFLDDLFSFMQRKGTPVNRIPIMAKQVLDIYELYKLVVARGGLVEVINKKIWREITKGLNLPSSITSAAFTLRTQYMKYLYPYECEKEKLSTMDELQQAIDGNRREGRRSSYGQYGDLLPDSPPQCNTPLGQNTNALNQLNAYNSNQLAALAQPSAFQNLNLQLAALAAIQNQAMNGNSSIQQQNRRRGTNGSQGATSSEEEDNASLSSLGRTATHRTPLNGQNRQDLALNLSGIIGQGTSSMNGNINPGLNGRLNNDYNSTRSSSSSDHLNGGKENNSNSIDLSRKLSDDELVTPPKRFLSEDDKNFSSFGVNSINNSTNIKITSKDRNGSSDKSQMQVSMEINGITYSGVLFAQHTGLRA